MTTVASPRPSLSIPSRRTSTSTDTIARSESTSRPSGIPGQRRNRAALREFYNLKNIETQAGSVDSNETLPAEELSPRSEIDRDNFDAEQYVKDIFAKNGLQDLLKVEAGLLRDIRGFDGERKALVYDNYSKLIGATETIRKMRGNMNPLRPAFQTLTPAIAHIAQTAASLSGATKQNAIVSDQVPEHVQQRRTVKHVLATPGRLKQLLHEGRREDALSDWKQTSAVLDAWQGVAGTADLRRECEEILG